MYMAGNAKYHCTAHKKSNKWEFGLAGTGGYGNFLGFRKLME